MVTTRTNFCWYRLVKTEDDPFIIFQKKISNFYHGLGPGGVVIIFTPPWAKIGHGIKFSTTGNSKYRSTRASSEGITTVSIANVRMKSSIRLESNLTSIGN
jgi:hypothetical protein